MPRKFSRIALGVGIGAAVVAVCLIAWYANTHTIDVLSPKGDIGEKQRQIIVYSTALMAIVVVPVLILTFGIAWRYREGNKKATYSPNLAGNRWAEAIWWIVPLIIISILSVVAWRSSHELDPYRPLASDVKPLKIQVIALEWKWLFIYPEEHVATVNHLPIPTNRPLDFTITSDAPMNSLWMPQLGGQVYAMSGMNTQLHLIATEPGDYRGSSANISGSGFADMHFTVHATDAAQFDAWASQTTASAEQLTADTYSKLAEPSTLDAPASFALPSDSANLYDTVIHKYMMSGMQEGK